MMIKLGLLFVLGIALLGIFTPQQTPEIFDNPKFGALTLQVNQGGTGENSFASTSLIVGDGTSKLFSTSSPTVGWLTATSTTGTSIFSGIVGIATSSPSYTLSVGGFGDVKGNWNVAATSTVGSLYATSTLSVGTSSQSGANIQFSGNVRLGNVGNKFIIKEKASGNASMGIATLSSGSVVVNNTLVTANSRIMLTPQNGTTNVGTIWISARTAGTSFTISSTNASDARDVAFWIIEPEL